MTNKTATPASTITDGINARIKDLHTCLPGVIKSYNPDTRMAEVYLAIKRVFKTVDANGNDVVDVVDLPMLTDVPVAYPSFGGFSLTLPVAAGDECLVMFCERDISRWLQDGVVSEPPMKRFHSLSDAVVVTGLRSGGNELSNIDNDALVIRSDDNTVSIKLNDQGGISIDANQAVTVTAPTVTVNGDLTVTGSLSVNGDTQLGAVVTSAGVNISGTHVHAQAADAGGDAQQPTLTPQ